MKANEKSGVVRRGKSNDSSHLLLGTQKKQAWRAIWRGEKGDE